MVIDLKMEHKRFLYDISKKIEACEFKEASHIFRLESGDFQLHSSEVVKLMVLCCITCSKNLSSPDKIIADDLYEFLQYVVRYLDNSVNSLDSYVQSVYHILKLLAEKESIEVIKKMRDIIWPPFVFFQLTNSQRSIYKHIYILLGNLISKYNDTVEVISIYSLQQISHMASWLCYKVDGSNKLFEVSYKCAFHLNIMGLPTKEQIEYYFYVLELLKDPEQEPNGFVSYNSFLKYISHLVINIFKRQEFALAHNFFTRAVGIENKALKSKEYVCLLEVLKSGLLVSPKGGQRDILFLDESLFGIKELQNLVCESDFTETCCKLLQLMHTIVMYYKNVACSEWCSWSEEVQSRFFMFLEEVSRLLSRSSYACPCKCRIYKGKYDSSRLITLILILLEVNIVTKNSFLESHMRECMYYIEVIFNSCKYLRENNCEKFENLWMELKARLGAIGSSLQNKEYHFEDFYIALIKYYISFKDTNSNNCQAAVKILIEFYSKMKNIKKCMTLLALSIYLYPERRDYFMSKWMMYMVGLRESTNEHKVIQHTTLVTFLKKNPFSVVINTAEEIDLLIYELDQYKKKWKSKGPIFYTFQQLYKVADLGTVAEVILNIFADCDMQVHEEMPNFLCKILVQYESQENSNKSPEIKLNLAILYFLRYKYSANETIKNNCDDMEKKMSVTKLEAPTTVPKEANDECDIVSSYDSLKLDNYMKLFKYIDLSLNYLLSAAPYCQLKKCLLELSFKLILRIAYEYRLHSHSMKYLQALYSSYEISKNISLFCKLQSINLIIECPHFDDHIKEQLIIEATGVTKDLDVTNMEHFRTLAIFYICIVKMFLYKDYNKAFNLLKELQLLINKSKHDGIGYIRAQMLVLEYKFVKFPCELNLQDHSGDTLVKIHLAFSAIFKEFVDNRAGNDAYKMSVLFEINEELIKLYHSLRMPREVRCYSKETTFMSQKMVLPLRCACLLMYLAHSDIKTTKLDDCQVKANGVSDILCMVKPRASCSNDEDSLFSCEDSLQNDVNNIGEKMQEMVLEVPSRKYKQLSPSSPGLVQDSFKIPSFMNHDAACDCFYCTCIDYQKLVLSKVYLDAVLNDYLKNSSLAEDFYKGSMNMHSYLKQYSTNLLHKNSSYIGFELSKTFFLQFFLEIISNILLDYSRHLARCNSKEKAMKLNLQVLGQTCNKKLEFMHIYNEALHQRLSFIGHVPDNHILNDDSEPLQKLSSEATTDPKTPNAKYSEVTITKIRTPLQQLVSAKKRIVKRIPFNLSPTENECAGSSKVSCETPQESPKSKRAPGSKLKMSSLKFDFAEPKLNTPVQSNLDFCLQSKTKRLTKKLMSSTKKVPVPEIVISNANKPQGSTCKAGKGLNVRKNLLEELTIGNDENTKNITVRRSLRIKK